MVSIIILTYNSSSSVVRLLKSLAQFTPSCEFILVDNGSSDNTVSLAKKTKIKLKIIETGENFGFAKGINVGAKNARGEYLLFINPDAEFMSGELTSMIDIFENRESIGVVGGKMIGESGNAEKSAGKFSGLVAAILIALGLDEKLGIRSTPGRLTKVDFVSGGFMMVKRELFNRLSGFDENLFMYAEDMEFCFRAKQIGYSTYFVPEVVVKHKGQGSASRGFAIKNIINGIIYFHKKHGTPFSLFCVKGLFWLKACTLVLVGKIINNRYLSDTYLAVLKA